MCTPFAQQVAGDIARRQSAEATERQHDMGGVLADSAPQRERLRSRRMDICYTMLIAERVVDPVVDAPGQGHWLLSRIIPLAQCSPDLSEGIIGLRKRRRLKVTCIRKREIGRASCRERV